jgi:hypothetical protein
MLLKALWPDAPEMFRAFLGPVTLSDHRAKGPAARANPPPPYAYWQAVEATEGFFGTWLGSFSHT